MTNRKFGAQHPWRARGENAYLLWGYVTCLPDLATTITIQMFGKLLSLQPVVRLQLLSAAVNHCTVRSGGSGPQNSPTCYRTVLDCNHSKNSILCLLGITADILSVKLMGQNYILPRLSNRIQKIWFSSAFKTLSYSVNYKGLKRLPKPDRCLVHCTLYQIYLFTIKIVLYL